MLPLTKVMFFISTRQRFLYLPMSNSVLSPQQTLDKLLVGDIVFRGKESQMTGTRFFILAVILIALGISWCGKTSTQCGFNFASL